MALEGHAVAIDLAGLGQGKDLKTTRIGQHGMRPLHKTMQSAHLTDKLVAGPQIQVIGIAQNKRSLDPFELLGSQGFDTRLGADRCKHRRNKAAMRSSKGTGTSPAIPRRNLEFKHRGDYTLQL